MKIIKVSLIKKIGISSIKYRLDGIECHWRHYYVLYDIVHMDIY